MAASPSNEAKLQAAMDRLLAGTPERTDGALTFENLYVEAEVSRATMNRSDVSQAFRKAIEPEDRRSPQIRARDETIADLQRKLRKRTQELTEATRKLDASATVILALHRENQELRQGTGGSVTPIGKPSKRHR